VGKRASCESECGRGALSCGTGPGRGIPVKGASYESEPERGRGTLSSWTRMRRTRYAVEAGCLLLWLSHFVFYYRWMWVPPYYWYRHIVRWRWPPLHQRGLGSAWNDSVKLSGVLALTVSSWFNPYVLLLTIRVLNRCMFSLCGI
jgi:hypothetical protein